MLLPTRTSRVAVALLSFAALLAACGDAVDKMDPPVDNGSAEVQGDRV